MAMRTCRYTWSARRRAVATRIRWRASAHRRVWDGDSGAPKQWRRTSSRAAEPVMRRGCLTHLTSGCSSGSDAVHAGHRLSTTCRKRCSRSSIRGHPALSDDAGDFALHHFIRALHAMEKIAERLPHGERGRIVELYWLGPIGICSRAPAFRRRSSSPSGTRATAVRSAATPNRPMGCDRGERAARGQEHNPKLVDVMRREWSRTGRARSIGMRRRSPRRPMFPRSSAGMSEISRATCSNNRRHIHPGCFAGTSSDATVLRFP